MQESLHEQISSVLKPGAPHKEESEDEEVEEEEENEDVVVIDTKVRQ